MVNRLLANSFTSAKSCRPFGRDKTGVSSNRRCEKEYERGEEMERVGDDTRTGDREGSEAMELDILVLHLGVGLRGGGDCGAVNPDA